MYSFRDLPLWAKRLLAPTVALLAMLAMAGTTPHNLAQQEANAVSLNGVVSEGLRSAMSASAAAADLQTELYHFTSPHLDAARQLSRQAAALTGEVNRFITDVKAA